MGVGITDRDRGVIAKDFGPVYARIGRSGRLYKRYHGRTDIS